MQQLPLSMRLRERAVFDSYVAGPNAAAVGQLQRAAASGSGGVFWLAGPSGVGKTHLLQASCTLALAARRTVHYLPLSELAGLGAGALSSWGGAAVLALDELPLILGQREGEQALFGLYRDAEQRGALLLMAAREAPAQLQFALPDMRSRCMAAMLLALRPLDERSQREALQRRARARGLELPEQTARYLQRHFRRDLPTLCQLLDEIDTAALQAQRRLTVPFIRAVLSPPRAG